MKKRRRENQQVLILGVHLAVIEVLHDCILDKTMAKAGEDKKNKKKAKHHNL